MALPTGAICLSDVNTELGKASNAPICLNDAAVRTLAEKPSGGICMSDLQGKQDGPIVGDAGQWLFASSGGGTCDGTVVVMPMGRGDKKGKPIGSRGTNQQSYPQYMRKAGSGWANQTLVSPDGNMYGGINEGGRHSHQIYAFDKTTYGKVVPTGDCFSCALPTGDAWSGLDFEGGYNNSQAGQTNGCWTNDSQFYVNTFRNSNNGATIPFQTYKKVAQPGNERNPYKFVRVSANPPFSFGDDELRVLGIKANGACMPQPMGKFTIFTGWRGGYDGKWDILEWKGESTGWQYKFHLTNAAFHPGGNPGGLNLIYAGTNPAGTVAFFVNSDSYVFDSSKADKDQPAIAYAMNINQSTGELTLKDKLQDRFLYETDGCSIMGDCKPQSWPCMRPAKGLLSPDGRWLVIMNQRKTDWQTRPNIYAFYFVRWDDTNGFEGKAEIKPWTPSRHVEDSTRAWEPLPQDFDISRSNNYIAYCGRPNVRQETMTFFTYEFNSNQDNPILSGGNPDRMIWSMDDDWRKADATCTNYSNWSTWNKEWTQCRFRPTGDLREMEDESIDLGSEAEPDGKEES